MAFIKTITQGGQVHIHQLRMLNPHPQLLPITSMQPFKTLFVRIQSEFVRQVAYTVDVDLVALFCIEKNGSG